MSENREQRIPGQHYGGRRGGEAGDSGDSTPPATDKVVRGNPAENVGDRSAPYEGYRGTEGGTGDGDTPPATDRPPQGD